MEMQQSFSLFSTLIFSNYFIPAFIQGYLVKFTDDNKNLITGLLYGFISVIMILFSPVSTLWIGATIAQVFAGKIDTKEHLLPFLLSLIVMIFIPINLPLVIYFISAAWADELIDCRVGYRPLLLIAALMLYSELHYLIGIACFDLGYLIAKHFSEKY